MSLKSPMRMVFSNAPPCGKCQTHGVASGAVRVFEELRITRVSFEEREDVGTIEVLFVRSRGAGHGENGGVEVETVDHDFGLHTCGNTGAGDDEGDAGAAFFCGYFSAIEWIVVGVALFWAAFHAAVVGGENEVGVFAELVAGTAWVIGVFEIRDDGAKVVVELLNHGSEEGVLLAGDILGGCFGGIDAHAFGILFQTRF